MSVLECRLGCGCELRYGPGEAMLPCARCDYIDNRCDIMCAVVTPHFIEVIRVGYAIAASRGVGPWAASFPRRGALPARKDGKR